MSIQKLLDIISKLRGPEGCPWDKAQTHESLAPYAVEEALELESAIYAGSTAEMIDELGDVLYQVVFHAELLKEQGRGDIEAVVRQLCEKLLRRHPHVFGEEKLGTMEAIEERWEKIKAQEREKKGREFEVKAGLPALRRAHRIGEASREREFDWSHPDQVWAKVQEELAEVEAATPAQREEELGDLLFSLAQWSRHQGLDPEAALQKANLKFERRFCRVLEIAKQKGLTWSTLSPEAKENLWEQVKRQERS